MPDPPRRRAHPPLRPPWPGAVSGARLLAGSLCLLLIGCEASSEGASEGGGVEALLEGRVEQEVAIGHPDDPDHAFTAVTGLLVGPDGTIWTKHRQEAVLRRWSAHGEPLGVVGRRGEGPGEFTQPSAMGTLGAAPGDSVWVHDGRLNRFTFLDWDGSVRSSRPAPFEMGSAEQMEAGSLPPRPQGLFQDGWVHASPPLPSDAVARGLIQEASHVAQDPGTGSVEVVATVPVGPTSSLAIVADEGGIFTSQPFGDAALHARSPDGSYFLLVDRSAAAAPGPATFRVTRIATVPGEGGTLRGELLLDAEIPYRAAEIPAAEVDRRMEAIGTSLYEAAGARMGLSEAAFGRRVSSAFYRPATRPPVAAVLAGRDGSTWIRMNEAPDLAEAEREADPRAVPGNPLQPDDLPRGQRWILLDEAGTPVQAVRLPPRTRPLLVELDRFWGVQTDELGVEYIVRYRVVPE